MRSAHLCVLSDHDAFIVVFPSLTFVICGLLITTRTLSTIPFSSYYTIFAVRLFLSNYSSMSSNHEASSTYAFLPALISTIHHLHALSTTLAITVHDVFLSYYSIFPTIPSPSPTQSYTFVSFLNVVFFLLHFTPNPYVLFSSSYKFAHIMRSF